MKKIITIAIALILLCLYNIEAFIRGALYMESPEGSLISTLLQGAMYYGARIFLLCWAVFKLLEIKSPTHES